MDFVDTAVAAHAAADGSVWWMIQEDKQDFKMEI